VRVLLLYISAVSGHRQAAEAVKQAFMEFYPEVEIRGENLFQHGNRLLRTLLDSLYYAIITLAPWFWDLIWDSQEVYWLTYALRNFLYCTNYLRLYREVILPFNPQAVICTHSIACALSSIIKKKKCLDYLLAAVPTDFCLHPYWFYNGVDVYFLPHEGLKENLVDRGIPLNKVQITGIPISPNFSRSKDRKNLKKKWGIKEDLFTILLMGGGQGMGSLKEIVVSLARSHLPIQLLVVTGINRRLRNKFRRMQSKLDLPLKVFGYTRKIDELMEISDLLISKPGGLTTAEALAKSLPLGIVDSLAGQERRNKEFLLEKELAFELKNKEGIVGLIGHLLNDFSYLEEWQRHIEDLACPQAAEQIAQKIISLVKEK
jgi:processive 1,2-diacylglycerol beta-glucosyltransferase